MKRLICKLLGHRWLAHMVRRGPKGEMIFPKHPVTCTRCGATEP